MRSPSRCAICRRANAASGRWSWGLLSVKEQSVLAQVSVFRGGFTEAAAQVVADATVSELQSLVDKSLIRHNETGRYDVHELWRQFAADKLGAQERLNTLTHH